MVKIRRIYDKPGEGEGFRILVDRLWPRGLSKQEVGVDLWLRKIAPGNELRKWFAHDPERWTQFKQRYFKELEDKKELVDLVIEKAREGNVTLFFGAREERFNNAVALKEYIETKIS